MNESQKGQCRYNKHMNIYIICGEGEEFCNKCKGRGRVPYKFIMNHASIKSLCCDKCLGRGKIDWVEKVVGLKVKETSF